MATSTVVVAREDLTIPGAVEASGLETNDPEHIENELFKTLEQNKADAVLLDLTASRGPGRRGNPQDTPAQRCAHTGRLPSRRQPGRRLSPGRRGCVPEPADRPDADERGAGS